MGVLTTSFLWFSVGMTATATSTMSLLFVKSSPSRYIKPLYSARSLTPFLRTPRSNQLRLTRVRWQPHALYLFLPTSGQVPNTILTRFSLRTPQRSATVLCLCEESSACASHKVTDFEDRCKESALFDPRNCAGRALSQPRRTNNHTLRPRYKKAVSLQCSNSSERSYIH